MTQLQSPPLSVHQARYIVLMALIVVIKIKRVVGMVVVVIQIKRVVGMVIVVIQVKRAMTECVFALKILQK